MSPDKFVFNRSSKSLTKEENLVLTKGLNFSVPFKKLNYCNFLIPFELLCGKLYNEPISETSGHDKDFVKTELKDIALTRYRTYSPPKSTLSDDELKIIKRLKADKTIVIVKPDKGNGVVILDRFDYESKMEELSQGTSKFTPLNDDPIKTTMKRETKIRAFLRKLKKANVISDEQFTIIASSRISTRYIIWNA